MLNYYSMLQANIFVKKVKFEFLQLNHKERAQKNFGPNFLQKLLDSFTTIV